MNNNSNSENYTSPDTAYEKSLAEALSLQLQRDSRRYSADFEN